MAPMAKKNRTPLTAKLARCRVWVQAAFAVAWLDPFAIRMHTVCSPVFHCYSCPLATFACPIGVLANFNAIHVFPFLALGTLTVVGAVFGTFVCSWACPFGFLQDLIARTPTPKVELPRWMGHFRYVVLVGLVLLVPYYFGQEHPLFFCRLCPAGALEAALPYTASLVVAGKEIVWPSGTKIVIFLLVSAAMLFTWRPWCALFCPLGAIYGIFNRVSFLFLKFHPDQCNDCDLCRRLCHYHGQGERRGTDMSCIRCLDCTSCTAVTLSNALQSPRKAETEPDLVTISPKVKK